MATRLTKEFFKEQGSIGGKTGGAKAWEGLTEEQRSERARQNAAKRKWRPYKDPDGVGAQTGKASTRKKKKS